MLGDPIVFLIVTLALGRGEGQAAGTARTQDQQDLAAAARGDQAALGRLYDRYGRMVYSLAFRITEDRNAAEEVTQDVFLQLWRRARAFDPSRGDVISWLITIGRSRAIDRLRSRQQRAAGSWVPLDDAPFLAALPVSVDLAAADQLSKALAALPEQQRKVIEMAYYQGFTQSEIASRLNEPLGTVKTWTRSGLKALREKLEA